MRVLVVENDPGIGEVVDEILAEAGHAAILLPGAQFAAVRALVKCTEPDCVLLDGGARLGYATSWRIAAWLRSRAQPVPVVMFTVDAKAMDEVRRGTSARSQHFAAVLAKPFEVAELVTTVESVGAAAPAGQPAAARRASH